MMINNNKLQKYLDEISGKNILIQGLGLNGGGVGTARFFLENGIPITVTDLKTENELESSIEELNEYKDICSFTLGCHKEEDFIKADIVVKGPGVPPSNKFLKIALDNGAKITTDLEIFYNIVECDIYGVTGSKGKSTTVSCIYSIFQKKTKNSFLGGNITISPLSFYKDLDKNSMVILELSSWQLRDLENSRFRLKGSCITNLMRDHQNYYSNMEDYLKDKAIIANNQQEDDFILLPYKDKYLNLDNIHTKSHPYYFSSNDNNADFFCEDETCIGKTDGREEKLFDLNIIKTSGAHTRQNIIIAAAFSKLIGIENKYIIEGIADFKGAPFRMELVKICDGVKYINDTTATIPEAAVEAIKSFTEPIIWIAGGNDKNLDFSVVEEISMVPKKILLLSGDGTKKMREYLKRDDIIESSNLDELVHIAKQSAQNGDVILFSPGCTSFGLFQNEFHRGRCFNSLIEKIINSF